MSFHNPNPRQDHWTDYYKRFAYFSDEKVRPYCHPRIMEHDRPTENAIVLVQGLTDSPFFMTAIARHFHDNLNYNVYLPLLHFHGLLKPEGMKGVDYREWKSNVEFAVDTAASKAKSVSIGGLSTGGTLSFYTAIKNPKVNGDMFLFSACLDIAGGLKGELTEFLLRTPIARLLDTKKPLVDPEGNPYRYAVFDLDGASELSKLMKETDALYYEHLKDPLKMRVFAAHSECDISANITGIEDLTKISKPGNFTFFRIDKKENVPHACLVLKDPVYAMNAKEGDEPLEEANPLFDQMMEAISSFVKTG